MHSGKKSNQNPKNQTNKQKKSKKKTKPKKSQTKTEQTTSSQNLTDIAEDEKITKWVNTNCCLSLTYKKFVTAGI